MAINNLSPINQKIISKYKEKTANQQPNVDLTQKTDTVSLSSKKVAINTGIGAVLGAIAGGVLSKFSKSMKNLINQSENVEKQATEEAAKEYSKKIADCLEEFWIKGNPSKETVEFLRDMDMDTKYGVFRGRTIQDIIDKLRKNNPKSYNEVENLLHEGCVKQVKSTLALVHKRSFHDMFEKYFKGDKKILKEIESSGEFIKRQGNPDFDIKDFINTFWKEFPEELENFKKTGKVKYPATALDYIDAHIPNISFQCNEVEIFENLEKQKRTELLSNISKLKNKLTVKNVALGAAIVSGVALAGSLIYKTVQNKKAEQNK